MAIADKGRIWGDMNLYARDPPKRTGQQLCIRDDTVAVLHVAHASSRSDKDWAAQGIGAPK